MCAAHTAAQLQLHLQLQPAASSHLSLERLRRLRERLSQLLLLLRVRELLRV